MYISWSKCANIDVPSISQEYCKRHHQFVHVLCESCEHLSYCQKISEKLKSENKRKMERMIVLHLKFLVCLFHVCPHCELTSTANFIQLV